MDSQTYLYLYYGLNIILFAILTAYGINICLKIKNELNHRKKTFYLWVIVVLLSLLFDRYLEVSNYYFKMSVFYFKFWEFQEGLIFPQITIFYPSMGLYIFSTLIQIPILAIWKKEKLSILPFLILPFLILQMVYIYPINQIIWNITMLGGFFISGYYTLYRLIKASLNSETSRKHIGLFLFIIVNYLLVMADPFFTPNGFYIFGDLIFLIYLTYVGILIIPITFRLIDKHFYLFSEKEAFDFHVSEKEQQEFAGF